MAAVKAGGKGGVLSGLAAAYLWGLVKGTAPPAEVTAPTERRIKGVRTRRIRLRDGDRTVWRAIPVTTVPRTLIDLSSLLPLPELARAFHEASVRYRTTPAQVEARLNGRVKGAENLRRAIRGDVHVTLSELERLFLRLLRTERLPLPETNRLAGGRVRRLPLARPQPDRRTRLLPLPQHPPRLGTRPPPRTRGLRPRRPVQKIHLRGRGRVPRRGAGGIETPPHSTGIPCRIVFSVTIRGSTNCSR